MLGNKLAILNKKKEKDKKLKCQLYNNAFQW
uniref:Uncharacterized protein n=1 Tax=Anguilla anguilla TaxID=7936 RepID=A0A0E9RXD7_ANGAN